MTNLDSICNVPADIICAILATAGVNDNITIRTWKDALSFLWVCRQWRIVAEPLLFSTLVCGNESYKCMKSNYVLILQHNSFNKINRIIVRDEHYEDDYSYDGKEYLDNIDMMMHFGKFFNDEAGKKDMDLLDVVRRGTLYNIDSDAYSQYSCDQYGNRILYNKYELNDTCRNASTNIVSKLAVLCPNVTHLFLRSERSTVTNDVLADILINYYMKQLVKLNFNEAGADYKLEDGHNIQSLILKNYNPKCGQLLLLPPYRIKNLSLSFEGGFNWDLFKLGDTVPVSYDNLIRLDVSGRVDSYRCVSYGPHTSSWPADMQPLVVFPRLQVLVLRYIDISYAPLKHLLQFSVKVLRVDGSIQHAYQLYGHNLDNLDRLILKINCYYFGYDDSVQTEFAQLTNKLFAKTGTIPEVHVMIALNDQINYLANINWVHITHLYVNMSTEVGQVFAAISNMSNLVCLEATIGEFDTDKAIESTLEFIAELKRNCTKPLQSKIKCVVVKYFCDYPSVEFVKALQFLKWYLPELKVLNIINI